MEAYRKVLVNFYSAEALKQFSDKILKDTDYELIPNMKTVMFHKNGIDFEYKRSVKRAPTPLKEWEKHWHDLTPFVAGSKDPYAKIDFHFNSDYNNDMLINIFEQNITDRTKAIPFPKPESNDSVNLKRVIGERGNPQYPIYIISKGRSETCVTADYLIKMEVPFRIVIEKSEWEDYKRVYGEERLLELDLSFRGEYDTYIKDFDVTKSKGSGPARNFVWWHAKNVMKADWHWIMDDNIFGFYYYNNHQRKKAVDGTLFASAEDFVNRYDNIAISGLNYYMFAVPGMKDRPYVANTKIYSCLLINNHADIRWAGRYNEDVDICIRALKEGYSTIQFDAFLARKGATQTMGGGNTDAFYAEEGTLPKSNMLAHNHPDITKVMWRFQRWHHITNYDIFDYYKDRTIGQTIIDMSRPALLDPEKDQDIINEIKNIDFNWIQRWDILENVEEARRDKIIDVLKFYRFTKDPERIINILTAPRLLNCDYYEFIWENEIPDTEDNKIMKDLLALGNDEDILFTNVNWDEYLAYVPEEKRERIVAEMIRNKYIQHNEFEKFTYNMKEFELTQEDHSLHHDSKARIINKFINKNNDLEEPVTYNDRKIRDGLKIKKKNKFKSQLTSRSEQAEKEHDGYTVMIHGSEDFNDLKLFDEVIVTLIPDDTSEIINLVDYEVDLMSANYALDNKIKGRDFVPNLDMHTDQAFRELYKHTANYADECILFIEKNLSEDLEFLKSEFEKQDKKITIISKIEQTENLEDW